MSPNSGRASNEPTSVVRRTRLPGVRPQLDGIFNSVVEVSLDFDGLTSIQFESLIDCVKEHAPHCSPPQQFARSALASDRLAERRSIGARVSKGDQLAITPAPRQPFELMSGRRAARSGP